MQTLLKLSLFLTLVTLGASLECETCNRNATNCTGPKILCEGQEVTCIIILTEITLDGPPVTKIEKGCTGTLDCSMPPVYLSLGSGRRVRQTWACCTDNCDTVFPDLLPIQTRANGVMCPACHEWKQSCQEEVTNCTGKETACFKIVSHTANNGSNLDRIMMGCTTKYTCLAIAEENTNFNPLSMESIQSAECTMQGSRASRSSGLLLPIFFGLLLLKIIS